MRTQPSKGGKGGGKKVGFKLQEEAQQGELKAGSDSIGR